MAQPTTTIVRSSSSSAKGENQNLDAITQALADHEEGLEALLQLVDALNDRGILEMVTALLKRGDNVLDILLNQAMRPDAVNGIKNLIAITTLLSQIDLTKWTELAAETTKTVQFDETPHTLGMWDLVKAFRDEDVVRGLSVGLHILKGFGQAASKLSTYDTGRNLDK